MKTQKYTALGAILIACAIAASACGGAKTNTNNANSNSPGNSNAPASTKNTAGGDYSTPTAAFKSFYEAAKKNDIAAMKVAMSKKTLETMEKAAAKENKSIDQAFAEMNKDAPANVPESRNEKIDGDKATLEIKDDKMDKWDTVPFARENGQWRIALLDEMAGAMEKLDSLDSGKK